MQACAHAPDDLQGEHSGVLPHRRSSLDSSVVDVEMLRVELRAEGEELLDLCQGVLPESFVIVPPATITAAANAAGVWMVDGHGGGRGRGVLPSNAGPLLLLMGPHAEIELVEVLQLEELRVLCSVQESVEAFGKVLQLLDTV